MSHGTWTKTIGDREVERNAATAADAVKFQNDGYRLKPAADPAEQPATAPNPAAGAAPARQPVRREPATDEAATTKSSGDNKPPAEKSTK